MTLRPSLREVLRARSNLAGHLARTPLHAYPGLSELLGAQVFVKHENHHALGAFKVRGGLHLAASLSPEERKAGLYTASTGNHGQSIANAGQVHGIRVTVAVPHGANPVKLAAMRALGAEVVPHGDDFDAAREWIETKAAEDGARFVSSADPELIAGVATYALEIVEDLPDADVIVVPVGAGTGAAGCCAVGKRLIPGLEVIGVQSAQAPTQKLTWEARRDVLAPMQTRAEGLATRVPFPLAQRILQDPALGLDDFVLVDDAEIDGAVRLLLEHTRNLAERAGAASLAAALRLRDRLIGRRVVLVLSGGNLAPDDLRAILDG